MVSSIRSRCDGRESLCCLGILLLLLLLRSPLLLLLLWRGKWRTKRELLLHILINQSHLPLSPTLEVLLIHGGVECLQATHHRLLVPVSERITRARKL